MYFQTFVTGAECKSRLEFTKKNVDLKFPVYRWINCRAKESKVCLPIRI
ncbi:hypothetical protein LEP1GSC050_3291 [Leptospira broomii serovar Hurstbridge str. 5399]|uniref:Uncharacterized protein n=1 Tax=Leptospira broomii serovar Hurstbridge str. 5399 TaxID=1049789 RepID=T0GIA2_9LEPT|nr:hypothetical protein LEP1GSC050_3291 [Leptospira broomii serovar Hurstbridge str. 5399]